MGKKLTEALFPDMRERQTEKDGKKEGCKDGGSEGSGKC